MTSINLLFQSVRDYINNYSILEGKSELLITFSYFIYDLIDKDLDFNEEYYIIIIQNLKELVKKECVAMLPRFQKITINIGKHYMGNQPAKLDEIIIVEDGKIQSNSYT